MSRGYQVFYAGFNTDDVCSCIVRLRSLLPHIVKSAPKLVILKTYLGRVPCYAASHNNSRSQKSAQYRS
jgi:hypothetical protein